jgi:CDP-diacylglycerol---serine O-phosphatidyltransferase
MGGAHRRRAPAGAEEVTATGSPPPRHVGLRRGVYVLPTLFTVGNIFCGFWAVGEAFAGQLGNASDHFRTAAILIFAAAFCDALDGRIARLTNSTSEFGEQYDSLCDVVSFGFAPAFLAWRWGLGDLGKWGFFAAFVFLICGSMRLARFNIMVHRVDKRYFIGLPIPAGAGVVASIILWHPEPITNGMPSDGFAGNASFVDRFPWELGWAALVVVVAFLMISTIRYRSFKDVDLKRRKSPIAILAIALVLALIAAEPAIGLALGTTVYAASGPVARLFRRKRSTPPDADHPTVVTGPGAETK